MNGLVQSVSDAQVLRHSMLRVVVAGARAQAVPDGHSVSSAAQSCVQYEIPVVGLPRTPPHTVQPAQLVTGTPSGDGATASTGPSTEASEPALVAGLELLEHPAAITTLAPRLQNARVKPSDT
jgi:hypothetical protein